MLPPDVTSIDLDICNLCNFGCTYCFHEDMKGHLARETHIDKVLDIIPSQNYGKFTIHFFGGEPLLAFERIKYMVDAAKKRKMGLLYSVTTNVSKFTDEIVRYFIKNNVKVHCSIDGNPKVQDSQRVLLGGQGTSHLVEPKVPLAQQVTPHDSVRMTITAKNVREYFDSIRYMKEDLKFKRCAPVCVPEDNWTKEDLDILSDEMEKTVNWVFENYKKGDWFEVKFITNSKPDNKKRGLKMCGASCNNIAIGLGGDIYPCHRFSRSDGFGMMWLGNIYEKNWQRTFFERRVLANTLHKNDFEMCLRCPAYDYCNGGCPHINFTAGLNHTQGESANEHQPPITFCEIKRLEHEWATYFWRKMNNFQLEMARRTSYIAQPSVKPPQKKNTKRPQAFREQAMQAAQYQEIWKKQKDHRETKIGKKKTSCC